MRYPTVEKKIKGGRRRARRTGREEEKEKTERPKDRKIERDRKR